MSKSEEFRQYADEALRSAVLCKTETERNALIDLARTWTLAALSAESPSVAKEPLPKSDDALDGLDASETAQVGPGLTKTS